MLIYAHEIELNDAITTPQKNVFKVRSISVRLMPDGTRRFIVKGFNVKGQHVGTILNPKYGKVYEVERSASDTRIAEE